MKRQEWNGFTGGLWQDEIDVRNFIQKNYTPYGGDSSFLCGPTQRTLDVRKKFEDLLLQEHANGGALKVDTETVITPTSFGPGYLDKEKDIIVGLQTDEPLKRACNPFGGMRMVRSACKAYGYEVSPKIEEEFKYHKTHNDGVFSAYTPEIKAARHVGLITGLPDAYGRGRIIGGAPRPDPGPGGHEGDGPDVRLRHLRPCQQRPGGRAVAVLRLPGRHQGAERRRHEPGPCVHLPGHLL